MQQSMLTCPICSGDNACTVQTDPYACWCMTVNVSDEQRKKLPQLQQCICSSCLQKLIAVNENC